MDCFLSVLVVVLLAAVGLLWLKVRLLQRCARLIGQAFRDRLATDTNTLIDLPSRDPHMRRLASDINAQLRLLRSQRQRYQRGDRQVKEAVTNISHDLRTPLTAICGYLELMKQQELPPGASPSPTAPPGWTRWRWAASLTVTTRWTPTKAPPDWGFPSPGR